MEEGAVLDGDGRLDEAREWVKRALEMEGEEADLMTLLKDIEEKIERVRAA